MKGTPLKLDLFGLFQWLRGHLHKVGYTSLLYLYSDAGVDAKLLLNRLMYLDKVSEWGWADDYVEYCSARCFASRAEVFRKKVQRLSSTSLTAPRAEDNVYSLRGWLPYVKLALFDIQELSDHKMEMQNVLDLCQRLVERGARVIITGDSYPSKAVKGCPEMARMLLDGYVVRVKGNELVFEGERPIRTIPLPFRELLVCNSIDDEGILGGFSSSICQELIFQWRLICNWRYRYKLFDFELFKVAFDGAWRFLQTKIPNDEHRARWHLLMLLGGFSGGTFYSEFLTDFGPTGNDVVYGDVEELKASECFTNSLIRRFLQGDFRKGDHIKSWSRDVSPSEFNEAIDDLVWQLKHDS